MKIEEPNYSFLRAMNTLSRKTYLIARNTKNLMFFFTSIAILSSSGSRTTKFINYKLLLNLLTINKL
jgi:hypothetical protein